MPDEQNVMDDSEVIDILRESPAGLLAGAIARKTTFAQSGSDRRLDRSLRRLSRAGLVKWDRVWKVVTR